jgi:hypothetical protein
MKIFSRSQDAVIRVCDEAGNVTETHEQAATSKSRRLFWSLTKPLAQIAAASMLKREEILVNCRCLA